MNSFRDKDRECLPQASRRPGPGRVLLLTATSFRRQPLFADWRCAQAAAAQVASATNWPGAELLCWVLMPDHWHGLVRFRDHAAPAPAMRQAKAAMARAVNLARGRGGLVWEPGYHGQVVRREEDVMPAARHVIAHPLRAGLVRRLGDYPYWDARWLPAADAGLSASRGRASSRGA